jgi:hypothetical protein
MLTKKLKSNSEISDEIIDSRVVNTLWDYINTIEIDIKSEITKAWYILGFQWTILFVASTKIAWLEDILPKLLLMCSFIISAFLSFFVIAWKKNVNHMSVVDSAKFDRSIALADLQEIYKKAQKSFAKKVLLNNINIIIQVMMLIGVLSIILFF